MHNGVKYNCEYCEYQATTKSSLRQHIQSIHNGVKHSGEFVIIKLIKKILFKDVQSQHSVHNAVKYNCHFCDYKASSHDNFRRHLQSIHNVNIVTTK